MGFFFFCSIIEWHCSHFSEASKTSSLKKEVVKGSRLLRKSTSSVKKRLHKGNRVTGILMFETEFCSFPTVSLFQYPQHRGPSNIQPILQTHNTFLFFFLCKKTPLWRALWFSIVLRCNVLIPLVSNPGKPMAFLHLSRPYLIFCIILWSESPWHFLNSSFLYCLYISVVVTTINGYHRYHHAFFFLPLCNHTVESVSGVARFRTCLFLIQ